VSSFWDRVAGLPGLSPVVDYLPTESPWARYVTRLHLLALERTARLRPTDRVLDFGCGVGRITDWLAPRVAEVIGLDTSRPMIEEARRRCAHANVRFEVVEAGLSPWTDLDAATAIWVFQHVLDDLQLGSALDDLARALRPGAHLYCIDRLSREPVDHGESSYLRLRTRAEYQRAFEGCGFRLVESFPVSIDEQVLGKPWLTARVKGGLALGGTLARVDLSWARRQQDPLVADQLYHWARSQTPAFP